MNAPHRRGVCPGLSAPMATGDGLLVRFTATEGISPCAFVALCAAARAHGNGTIEISARGSLQVRGLSVRSAPAFARAVAALDIAAADRPSVIVDPLAGDPDVRIDSTSLAGAVRHAVAAARLVLAPKVCVVLDGGGRLHLDALSADVRLRATGPVQAPRLHVSIAGDAACATPLGSIPPEAAPDTVVRVLRVIASHGPDARASDVLRRAGPDAFRAGCEGRGEACGAPQKTQSVFWGPRLAPTDRVLPPRPPVEPIGIHPLRDGTVALGIALAFGHAHADALAELARLAAGPHRTLPHAEEHRTLRCDASRSMSPLRPSRRSLRTLFRTRTEPGDTVRLRPAPDRSLLLVGIAREHAEAIAEQLEREGFIVRPDDPRRRVVACPGKPACASGLLATRALAAEIAPRLPPSRDIVHVSGCAKGCAHPAPAALTIVGTERGCGIIERGDARALPSRHVADADIVIEAVRLAMQVQHTRSAPSPRLRGEGWGAGGPAR
jgi:precorrin-3B synthase